MDAKERKQYEKLVLTPVSKLIPALAVPTVASMMTTMIYNLVDSYFVGLIGTSAAAATGILVSIQAIFQAIGFMHGHGSGSIISRRLGEGDQAAAHRFASTAFFLSLAVSCALALLGLVFLEPLMRALGSTETILPYAKAYGFYMLIAGPGLTAACVLNNIMRYEGKASLAMVGLVSGGVLNMVGDPVLMFGLGMGIDGAGLSTAASQWISVAILMSMYLRGKTISRIRLRAVTRDPREYLAILRNGMPSLIRQVLNSVATMTLNLCAGPYGDAAIAAMTIDGRIMMLMGSVMIGVGQGLQPVAAYNYGAHKYRRVRDGFKFTWGLSEVLMAVFAVIGWVFAPELVWTFRADPAVVEMGVPALRCMCVAIVAQCLGVVCNMCFQAIGWSRSASFLASLRSGIYYIPTLLVMPRFIGLAGIQSAQMVADILTLATCVPFAVRFFRRLPDRDERSAADDAYHGSAG